MSEIVRRLSGKRFMLTQDTYQHAEEAPGLYCFWARKKPLYVGKSSNLKRRVKRHCDGSHNPELKECLETYPGEIDLSLSYYDVDEKELTRLESQAIKEMNPVANRVGLE